MNRQEKLLRAHHLKLSSNLPSDLITHLSPFSSLEQRFFEVVWNMPQEEAILLAAERDKVKWRRSESVPIHVEFWENVPWKRIQAREEPT